MVYSRQEAVKRSLAYSRYPQGLCQVFTRTIFGAPSVGDVDGDGDADAVDGWFSEPPSARHPGDRNPPAGVPTGFSGGSRGFGHRAPSVGGGKIRSTDMNASGRYQAGSVATVTIPQVEAAMGVCYTGWTETISGLPIPGDKPTPPPKPVPPSQGKYIDKAVNKLQKAEGKGLRGKLIAKAKKVLSRIKPV